MFSTLRYLEVRHAEFPDDPTSRGNDKTKNKNKQWLQRSVELCLEFNNEQRAHQMYNRAICTTAFCRRLKVCLTMFTFVIC